MESRRYRADLSSKFKYFPSSGQRPLLKYFCLNVCLYRSDRKIVVYLGLGLTVLKCVITKYGGQLINIVQNFSYVGDVGSNAADATLARQ